MESVKLSALRDVAGRQKTTSSPVGQTGLHPDCLRVLVKVEDDSPGSLSVSQPQRTNKLDLNNFVTLLSLASSLYSPLRDRGSPGNRPSAGGRRPR